MIEESGITPLSRPSATGVEGQKLSRRIYDTVSLVMTSKYLTQQ